MRASEDKPSDTPRPPDTSTVVLLLGTIGDTTWRMFVPTIGLTVLGVYGDNTLATKPWLTIAGIIIGTALAIVLIRNQLRNVRK
jgi:hypothetical protein